MFDKFTPIEFLYEVRKAYREAQEVKMRNGNNDMRLQRYRAHSISSVTEDLFARFLAENFSNEDLYFFVDIPLTYN